MDTFQEAADKLETELNKLGGCIVDIEKSNRKKYQVNINGENIVVILVKTDRTNSEGRKTPQVRIFQNNIFDLIDDDAYLDKRHFFLVYSERGREELELDNISPYDYIISLESDWSHRITRPDITSLYQFVDKNSTYDFKKIKNSEHASPTTFQATFFKRSVNGYKAMEGYLRYFDSRLLGKLNRAIDRPVAYESNSIGVNKIYFGAPGTGKSYGIQQFIRENGIPDYDDILGHPNVYRTTLHPEFTYYDFVGQVMPKVVRQDTSSVNNRIEYDFVPNIFTNALKFAVSMGEEAGEELKAEPVFLILEEMSRANVAAIFGDIFQLLDRNIETGASEYRINNDFIANSVYGDNRPIHIPSNLFIIGTVNTNDQNVFVMDTAFKRRFLFDYMSANKIAYDGQGKPLNNFTFSLENKDGERDNFNWITMYRALNKIITKKVANGGLGLKEDMQLGQFFIKFKNNDNNFNLNQIQGKLLQYLYSDIEDISYTEVSLFKPHINSFGDAYMRLGDSENIFSEGFMAEYASLAKEDASQGLVDD